MYRIAHSSGPSCAVGEFIVSEDGPCEPERPFRAGAGVVSRKDGIRAVASHDTLVVTFLKAHGENGTEGRFEPASNEARCVRPLDEITDVVHLERLMYDAIHAKLLCAEDHLGRGKSRHQNHLGTGR